MEDATCIVGCPCERHVGCHNGCHFECHFDGQSDGRGEGLRGVGTPTFRLRRLYSSAVCIRRGRPTWVAHAAAGGCAPTTFAALPTTGSGGLAGVK